jgi:HAD superfamily hydrolase (TIGR01484 family)
MDKAWLMDPSPKAIFLDIDGTIIIRGEGPFADDLAAIGEAREAGHRILLNTGRSLANIPPDLAGAPWLDGIVAGGGAHVVISGETWYHKWVDTGVLCAISAWYLERDKWIVFEGETGIYGINQDYGFQIVSGPDDFRTRYAGTLISKITLEGRASPEETAMLERHFRVFDQGRYTECILKGENKGQGMEIALRALGIERKNSIAIGDSVNDTDMIRHAGLGIAMGNASDELKELAAEVTDDCGQGGVAKAIRRWVLNNHPSRISRVLGSSFKAIDAGL